MTSDSDIDVRDLGSVRRAARGFLKKVGNSEQGSSAGGDVLIGDDWVGGTAPAAAEQGERRRGIWALRRSPMARKIVTYNLVALLLIMSALLHLAPSRNDLVEQRVASLSYLGVFMGRLVQDGQEANPALGPADVLQQLAIPDGVEVWLYDPEGAVTTRVLPEITPAPVRMPRERATPLSDVLDALGTAVSGLRPWAEEHPQILSEDDYRGVLTRVLAQRVRSDGDIATEISESLDGSTLLTAASPLLGPEDELTGYTLALIGEAQFFDSLLRQEHERVLQVLMIGVIVSVVFSLMLASTITNPISDLAAAAESGRDRNARKMAPSRVRIPDLTARPDEIGRLSAALRGMVAALYHRIDSNEQFAADVAHEIKNPLASLRSAIGSLRMVKREDHRDKLLDVIEHDVRRLDRLVTDISSASRLDADLVKEEEERFDLLKMLNNLSDHLGEEAAGKGIEFIADLPGTPVHIQGLEGRLAQVFVNLISNAISFCDDGDAIRIWARRRANRVLVVVEDTGPGIPEDALAKIFQRFYSERPQDQFGDNSGLGLAISKQIVEAHGGVIWAENIRPTEADPTSDPLGARFVVGLPL
ncbi:ATP-binding protein [Pseudoroseicyclus aestuarii]|uniref:histidine kinase n=1 Tax=Pseudoroseicyclus aestuarii TaxID=1795041 RepID=A0A318T469_9RHOB|nr:ATP-binding protein [Pseudoroseicyclus aestuarii]PYE85074.1 two-component system sensor histidine kinase ChvG [Pseudoroseicyclus aestuarii]